MELKIQIRVIVAGHFSRGNGFRSSPININPLFPEGFKSLRRVILGSSGMVSIAGPRENGEEYVRLISEGMFAEAEALRKKAYKEELTLLFEREGREGELEDALSMSEEFNSSEKWGLVV